jgi:prepilin-type N-terminal cleavage/methylation domain-containing protein
MKKNNPGFSLIELILSTAIMTIVLLCVYSSFTLGIRAWQTVNSNIDQDAQKFFTAISEQLRCAYISKTDPGFSFEGSLGSVRFTTTAKIDDQIYINNASDLQKVSYLLSTDQKTGKRQLTYESYDVLSDQKDNFKTVRIYDSVNSLSFLFYDGTKWVKGWNSTEKLPIAVKIKADLQKGVYQNSFQTIVIPICARNS